MADRLLLVTASDPAAPAGGREMLYRLNHALLGDLFGDRLSVFRLSHTRPGLGAMLGRIDGVDRTSLAAIDAAIREHAVTHLFLDGSNLGAVARAVRRRHAQVRIVTFFHNVEARFFLGALRARPTPRALAVLVANMIAERAAVHASDTLVCLSARDSAVISRLYNRAADHIAPIALEDSLPQDARRRNHGDYALFVGGGFYANLAGARWFAEQVAPRLAIPTKLVGRGLEPLAAPLAHLASVDVIGEVASLADWYRDAAVVVAPIFDGSGMKTKVAEALMHGKHVVGTTEAFVGYDADVIAASTVADDADAFVAAIAALRAREIPALDPAMRALYDAGYSRGVALRRMAAIID